MSARATTRLEWRALRDTAERLLTHAHAPYSGLSVAAALIDDEGQIFGGVNVENASYGLTVCAERNAIAAAIAHGCRSFRGLALASSSEHVITPCGACRQVLVEFPPGFAIRCYGRDGSELRLHTDRLLPKRFALQAPIRTLSRRPAGRPRS